MPKNVATGKGRLTALTNKEMKHLHSHGVNTRKEFWKYFAKPWNQRCDKCWIIWLKLEAYTEKKSSICYVTNNRRYQSSVEAPTLYLKSARNMDARNDWTLFTQLLSESKMRTSIVETSRWTTPVKCPKCERELLAYIISFALQERHVFDVCQKCNYAYHYEVANPKIKEDSPVPAVKSSEPSQPTLF